MSKRGQVAVFVIVGVVVVIIVALLFFLRGSLVEGLRESGDVGKQLELEMNSIEKGLKSCLKSESVGVIEDVGLGGGYYSPISVIGYSGEKFTVLCSEFSKGDGCLSSPIVKKGLSERMASKMENRLKVCFDIDDYADETFEISGGVIDVSVEVIEDNVLFTVNYPITVSAKGAEVVKDTFYYNVDSGLGKCVDGVNDILNVIAVGEIFDEVQYSLVNFYDVIIEVRKMSGDSFYLMDCNDYKFNFGVKGFED